VIAVRLYEYLSPLMSFQRPRKPSSLPDPRGYKQETLGVVADLINAAYSTPGVFELKLTANDIRSRLQSARRRQVAQG
jgi:hypothetical protein